MQTPARRGSLSHSSVQLYKISSFITGDYSTRGRRAPINRASYISTLCIYIHIYIPFHKSAQRSEIKSIAISETRSLLKQVIYSREKLSDASACLPKTKPIRAPPPPGSSLLVNSFAHPRKFICSQSSHVNSRDIYIANVISRLELRRGAPIPCWFRGVCVLSFFVSRIISSRHYFLGPREIWISFGGMGKVLKEKLLLMKCGTAKRRRGFEFARCILSCTIVLKFEISVIMCIFFLWLNDENWTNDVARPFLEFASIFQDFAAYSYEKTIEEVILQVSRVSHNISQSGSSDTVAFRFGILKKCFCLAKRAGLSSNKAFFVKFYARFSGFYTGFHREFGYLSMTRK